MLHRNASEAKADTQAAAKHQRRTAKQLRSVSRRIDATMSAWLKLAVFLLVVATPGLCKTITVCQEEDQDIRVDCVMEPKPNQINSYTFSISKGNREYVVNTNSTTATADKDFRDKSTVEQIGSNRLRLRLHDYTFSENTTFICKISTDTANVFVLKSKMLACSTISVFLHSCPWLLYILLSLHAVQSWSQA